MDYLNKQTYEILYGCDVQIYPNMLFNNKNFKVLHIFLLFRISADLPALMQTSGATSTNLLWPWKNTHQRISETQYYITLSITLFYAYLSAITTINFYTRFCCTLS